MQIGHCDTIADENTQNIEKLESKLFKATTVEKLTIFNQLSQRYLDEDPEMAKKYATKAIELANLLEDKPEKSLALYNLGNAYYSLLKYDNATDAYEYALKEHDSISKDTLKSNILVSIGLCYLYKNEYDSARSIFSSLLTSKEQLLSEKKIALIYSYIGDTFYGKSNYGPALINYHKALNIAKTLDDKYLIATINNDIGIVYNDLGNYEKSLNYYMESLDGFKKANSQSGISQLYNNIGIVYSDCNNREKALEYYQKSLQIDKKLGNTSGIAGSYNNIGIIYSEWGQDDVAIEYYSKSLKIYQDTDNKVGIAQVTNNLGESYFEIGEYTKALDFLQQSLRMEEDYGNKRGIAESYLTLGESYFTLNNFPKALSYVNQSLNIADSLKLSLIILKNYMLLYKIYEKEKNYPKAFKYLKQYTNQKDSVYNENFRKTLMDVQVKNEITKIELDDNIRAQAELTKKKSKQDQRFFLIIILFLILLFGVLVFYDLKAKAKINRKLLETNEKLTIEQENFSDTLEKLSKSERKYKSLVENSPTGILLLNKSGKILEVNKKILELFGSPDEEEIKKINCFKHQSLENSGITDDLKKCIELKKLIYNEIKHTSKWGKTVYLKYYITPILNRLGNVSNIILNIEDITKSKEAELAITESELKYQILVENSLQAMFIMQDDKLLYANKNLENLTMYSFNEMTKKGKNWLKTITYPDDYKKASILLKRLLSEKAIPEKSEFRIISKNNKIRWVESLGTVIDYNGKKAALVVAVDITRYKESVLVLEQSEEKLRQLNATKDKFFSIVAHDLKNPFNAIMGFSNLLSEAYDNFNENQRKTFVRNIRDATENTYKLLQNLLEWSRTQTQSIEYKPDAIELNEIITSNISVLKSSAANKDITITMKVPSDTIAFVDENMAKTVIRNLLSNAIKFTRPGGNIEITTSKTGNYIEVCVADNGVGISKENQKKLFKIDEQFKSYGTSNEQGSGLGLLLCKEFVEKNGGKIWVESKINEGSKFKFTLPGYNFK
jgi:PAS domain S-box-containing protein